MRLSLFSFLALVNQARSIASKECHLTIDYFVKMQFVEKSLRRYAEIYGKYRPNRDADYKPRR